MTRFPDFLFIGPDKSGSTWIYDVLRWHPQIFMPAAKELFYFDRYYERGPQWYAKHFQSATGEHLVAGEVSHDYLYSLAACERIARDLPNARLMVCLREPKERAVSSYLYMVRQGRIRSDFNTALKAVPELVDHGRYARLLAPYLERFPREQLYVSVFDDLRNDPAKFARALFIFLGVEDQQPPVGLLGPQLTAAAPRSATAAGLARKAGLMVRALGFPRAVNAVKRAALVQRALYRPLATGERPFLDEQTLGELDAVFEPEVNELDEMLQLGLSERWGYAAPRAAGQP